MLSIGAPAPWANTTVAGLWLGPLTKTGEESFIPLESKYFRKFYHHNYNEVSRQTEQYRDREDLKMAFDHVLIAGGN